jgi:RDD family protein
MRGQFPEGVPSVSPVLRRARQVPVVLHGPSGPIAPPAGSAVNLGSVVSRRELGSWLEPQRPPPGSAAAYPGERLGRPADGPRSLAGFGRRLVALVVDWVVALLIAGGLLRNVPVGQFGPLLVLLVENVVLVGTAGATLGHRLLGMRVEALDGTAPGPGRALIRSVLLCLAIPPLVWDADHRGLHDRWAGTLVART